VKTEYDLVTADRRITFDDLQLEQALVEELFMTSQGFENDKDVCILVPQDLTQQQKQPKIDIYGLFLASHNHDLPLLKHYRWLSVHGILIPLKNGSLKLYGSSQKEGHDTETL
jgi:hypothetical protein